ncbi:TPA: hypothetical protein ACGW3V_005820, partial [Pseudomonas aeruginosa]
MGAVAEIRVVKINLSPFLDNSGLIEAGKRLDLLAGDSIRNRQGGVIAGRDVSLTALTGDVINERSVTRYDSALDGRTW